MDGIWECPYTSLKTKLKGGRIVEFIGKNKRLKIPNWQAWNKLEDILFPEYIYITSYLRLQYIWWRTQWSGWLSLQCQHVKSTRSERWALGMKAASEEEGT